MRLCFRSWLLKPGGRVEGILEMSGLKVGIVLLFNMLYTCIAWASMDSLLGPENVAVIVNTQDPNSIEVGTYYLKARNIPAQNLIGIEVPVRSGLSLEQFNAVKAQIDSRLSAEIKVLAVVWTRPYAVVCNSITAALTLGYDEAQCRNGCAPGKKNPYFNSNSLNPMQDHAMRLAMLIPTDSVETAKSLIDRGVLTGFNLSPSTGYFLRTTDKARSTPREPFFPKDFFKVDSRKILFRNMKQNDIQHKKDIMFYMTGLAQVRHLETLNFMPGAIADHLTSFGGALDQGGNQMKVTAWLKAGATGSYGTVTEPCSHWQKFPNPEVLVKHYLAGNTLVEAYWKSVYWPAQGLFVGEPLAAPFKGIH